MPFVMGVIFCIPLLLWGCVRTVNSLHFEQEIGGYLEQAAAANNVTLAEEQLGKAMEAIKAQKLETGSTAIFDPLATPGEDVEFWSTNLSVALYELKSIPAGANRLERATALLKLRETLMDDAQTEPRVPPGISRYPHNGTWALLGLASGLLFLIGLAFLALAWDDA